MQNENVKSLKKFAFWNKKEAKKVLDLKKKANKEDVYKLHARKCGLCGS